MNVKHIYNSLIHLKEIKFLNNNFYNSFKPNISKDKKEPK